MVHKRSLAEFVKGKPYDDLDAIGSNDSHPLYEYAKAARLAEFIRNDPPISDATAQMLIAAQGPKAFSYLSPELTTALRVSNTVKNKDPMRLTGIPSKKELADFKKGVDGSRDKLLWKTTGNGIKANQWSSSYGN